MKEVLILAVDLLIGRVCLTEGLRARPWPVLDGTGVDEVGRPGLLSTGALRGLELLVAGTGFLAGVAMLKVERRLNYGGGEDDEDVLESKRETSWNLLT